MAESVQYCLRVIVGKSYGEEFLLSPGEERVIGSEDAADIRLPDDGVEPRHARVQLEHDELRVVDIGGAKSMKVNGSKQRSARLENGDQLALGAVTLRVQRRVRFVGERDGNGPGNGTGNGNGHGKKKKRAVLGKEPEAPVREVTSEPVPSASTYGEPSAKQDGAASSVRRGGAAAALTTTERGPSNVEVLDREEDLQHEDATVAMAAVEEHGLWWPKDELPPLELQHVWFDLARNDRWRSLAVVPTDAATPTLPVAHAFARMASLNPQSHVLLVDATPREPLLGQKKRPLAGTIASQVKQFPQANYDFLDASSLGLNDAEVAHLYIPQLLEYISSGTGRYNKVLIAVGSLLQHARSIPVARAVDAVLLNVGVGTSRLPDVNRTLEIVGRDRVMGSLTVEGID